VRLVLRVQLVDVRDRRLLGGDTLRLEQPAPSDDAAGGVAAANALLEQAVRQIGTFCARSGGA
jgi:cholesterol transport system auxiliary component